MVWRVLWYGWGAWVRSLAVFIYNSAVNLLCWFVLTNFEAVKCSEQRRVFLVPCQFVTARNRVGISHKVSCWVQNPAAMCFSNGCDLSFVHDINLQFL